MKESTEFAGWAAAALLVAGSFQGMAAVTVQKDSATGQVVVTEDARPVLQYNYQTIEPGERLAQVSAGNRIYARARSDYIHPLYEPSGAVLTKDWPVDHPHHRGIYWAWPEVQYGQELGDLHALQKVFSRATGRLLLRQKDQCAEIEAENQWLWEDKEAVVREHTLIRVHPADGHFGGFLGELGDQGVGSHGRHKHG